MLQVDESSQGSVARFSGVIPGPHFGLLHSGKRDEERHKSSPILGFASTSPKNSLADFPSPLPKQLTRAQHQWSNEQKPRASCALTFHDNSAAAANWPSTATFANSACILLRASVIPGKAESIVRERRGAFAACRLVSARSVISRQRAS